MGLAEMGARGGWPPGKGRAHGRRRRADRVLAGGAEEDWAVARELLDGGRVRHSPFLAHLALEKALKAHVCRETRDVAPKIHNLLRLSELAGLKPTQAQLNVLAEMNTFYVEGRYPEPAHAPTSAEGQAYITRAEAVFLLLMSLLQPWSATI